MDYNDRIKWILWGKFDHYAMIKNDNSAKKIYELFVLHKIFRPKTAIEMLYVGHYYRFVKTNYVFIEKYYMMAYRLGNKDASLHLGCYYCNDVHNPKLTRKYFSLSTKHGNIEAMNNLGWWYQNNKKYNEMEKYYLMGIEKGYSRCFGNLRTYYASNNMYIKLLKLYIMFHDPIKKINVPNIYCSEINYRFSLIEYFNNILNKNLTSKQKLELIDILISFNFTIDDKLSLPLKLLIKYIKDKLSLIDSHFRYVIRGEGYINAKNHFIVNSIK